MKEKGFSFGDNSLDLIRMFAALQIALTHYLKVLDYAKKQLDKANFSELKAS